jgi:hypothetical protein
MSTKSLRWIDEVASRRSWQIHDIPNGTFGRRLVGVVGSRPWHCDLTQRPSDDGEPHRLIEWQCPSIEAPGPGPLLVVNESSGADLGATGTGVDLVIGAAAVVRGLARRRAQPTRPVLDDIRSLLHVEDPLGLFTGDVEQRYLHWPTPDITDNVLARALRSVEGVASTHPARPADAPSKTLRLRCDPTHPLTLSSQGWWGRPLWLEHHVDLGCEVVHAFDRSR